MSKGNEMFVEKPEMTREEYHRTPDFVILRFLNNIAADIQRRTQELHNVLELMLAFRPDFPVYDKFCLVERQLRIVNLEASNLWSVIRDLEDRLKPKKFSDDTK